MIKFHQARTGSLWQFGLAWCTSKFRLNVRNWWLPNGFRVLPGPSSRWSCSCDFGLKRLGDWESGPSRFLGEESWKSWWICAVNHHFIPWNLDWMSCFHGFADFADVSWYILSVLYQNPLAVSVPWRSSKREASTSCDRWLAIWRSCERGVPLGHPF